MKAPSGYHVWFNIDPDMFNGDEYAHYAFIESDDMDDALWQVESLARRKSFPPSNTNREISYCIQAAKPESPFNWGQMFTVWATK